MIDGVCRPTGGGGGGGSVSTPTSFDGLGGSDSSKDDLRGSLIAL